MSAYGHRLHFDEDGWAQCPEGKTWYHLVQGEVKPTDRKE
jgi:UDP-2-acetamido-3-amino-2,3-dideoxy-glucuronate N-acetyltransferase